MIDAPAPRPCSSCPYRRDVPSGIWAAEEYAKLRRYDEQTPSQPTGVFCCHVATGSVCAGWAATHDGQHLLALRLAPVTGYMTSEAVEATIDYETPVECFSSGTEAADHGEAELLTPGRPAVRAIEKIERIRPDIKRG